MAKQPRGKDVSFVLTWNEGVICRHGEGVSRTSDPKAKLWSLIIQIPGQMVLRSTIRAHTRKEAKEFATNCHPTATSIIVVGQA
jgi:hypothetical protein